MPVAILCPSLPNLALPEGIRLVYLPPYTPEIQPAERLWPLVDEPIVNQFFDTIDNLDDAIAQRCRVLTNLRPRRPTHQLPLVAETYHPELIIRK